VSGEDETRVAGGAEPVSDRDTAEHIREVRFVQISGGRHEVIVEYAGNKYRLLATKNGRLVLNK
jgi:hemin uptake protein HemP